MTSPRQKYVNELVETLVEKINRFFKQYFKQPLFRENRKGTKESLLPNTLKPLDGESSCISSPKIEDSLQTEDQDLQREILLGRKFSLAEAFGREGGCFMKGESAIPRPLRAVTEIKQFINSHIDPSAEAISSTLFTWASTDSRVSRQLDTPLVALTQIVESLLSEPTTFYEFARQVAIAQSHLTGERPHFQQPGQQPHPDAEHTHQSITAELQSLLKRLQTQLQKPHHGQTPQPNLKR